MRFQRGPVLAYAAVVLVGLLVLVQTLSPDVSSLHRVPRTLAGQADFTVVPPTPTPDVSGVDPIPSAGAGSGAGDGADTDDGRGERGGAAEPGKPGQGPGGDASDAPPAATPTGPPADDPTTPSDPGDDESEPAPPTLVPSVGPIPGIMAPLIWPFVSAEDSRPLDEAMPMFLRQLIEADPGATVEDLPSTKDETISAGEAPKVPQQRRGLRKSAPEPADREKTCDGAAQDEPSDRPLPRDPDGASTTSEPRDEDGATPECAEACAEPDSPVGSSPAADGEESTDPDAPSDGETSEAPVTEEPSDGSESDKTCAEGSAQ